MSPDLARGGAQCLGRLGHQGGVDVGGQLAVRALRRPPLLLGTIAGILILLGVAFGYAHKLEDAFWDAKLELGATPGADVWSRQEKEYARRFSVWMKSR